MVNRKRIWLLLFFIPTLFFSPGFLANDKVAIEGPGWDYMLNEMNYLVLRASSINIIHGLHLTVEQATKLKKLATEMKPLALQVPDTRGNTYEGLVRPRQTFITLIEHLKEEKPIPDKLKKRVNAARLQEAEIIKKTIAGAREFQGNQDNSCLACHAAPADFPGGEVTGLKTGKISDKERKIIDKAHVKAIFGDEGMIKLWMLKDEVSGILTNGQEYMLKDFRCGFIPPGELQNPTNIGQAFVHDKWVEYFKETRGLTDEEWKEYKQLYLIPVEDIIEATLPGIKRKYKKNIIKDFEAVIEEARAMDEIDFEIQKNQLCNKLQDALNVDFLIGENKRDKEERQFIAAMFLLFPGCTEIYDKIIMKPR
jgi:hypothetical protein